MNHYILYYAFSNKCSVYHLLCSSCRFLLKCCLWWEWGTYSLWWWDLGALWPAALNSVLWLYFWLVNSWFLWWGLLFMNGCSAWCIDGVVFWVWGKWLLTVVTVWCLLACRFRGRLLLRGVKVRTGVWRFWTWLNAVVVNGWAGVAIVVCLEYCLFGSRWCSMAFEYDNSALK